MQFSSFSRLGICLGAALMCTQINAQGSYRGEILFLHSNSEFDTLDSEVNILAGTYYFSPVESDKGPLAESKFLSRSSAASVILSRSELDGQFGTSLQDSESSGYGLSLEIRDPNTPNTVSAGFIKDKIDVASPIKVSRDLTTTAFALGRYFSDNFHVDLRFFKLKHHDLPAGWDDMCSYALASKFVKQLENGKAYNFEATLDRTYDDNNYAKEVNTTFTLEGDYYPNSQFAIGGGLNLNRGDDEDIEGETLSLRTSYFFSPSLGIQVESDKFYPKKPELSKEKSISATIALRF